MENNSPEGSDDNDHEGPRPTRKKRQRCAKDRLFMCHFFARDNLKYWSYHGCKTGFPEVHRIKAHIYKSHLRPRFYCPRCCKIFTDSSTRDGHIRDISSDPCEAKPGIILDGITDAQEALLRKKTKRKSSATDSETEKWNEIWHVIFPGEEPPSPFFGETVTSMQNNSKELSEFCAYWPANYEEVARPIVRVRLENKALEFRTDNEVIEIVMSIFKQVFERLLLNYRSSSTLETQICEDALNNGSTNDDGPRDASLGGDSRNTLLGTAGSVPGVDLSGPFESSGTTEEWINLTQVPMENLDVGELPPFEDSMTTEEWMTMVISRVSWGQSHQKRSLE